MGKIRPELGTMYLKLRNDIIDSRVPEKEVKIQNKIDLNLDKNDLIIQAAEQLGKVANPIRREQYDHEVKDSRVNEVF